MSKHLAHDLGAKWRSNDVKTNEESDFSCFNLDREILTGLSRAGYKVPSPIQLQAIPLCLTGDDVFVQGKPGTGKTLVFSILALTKVLEATNLKVLIVAATREGADHIYRTIDAIGSGIGDLKCKCFIGGFDVRYDRPETNECQIAVGTPGRILQLLSDGELKPDNIKLFVIDDFDALRDERMKPEVSAIIDLLPEEKQTITISMMCSSDIFELASHFLKESYRSCFNDSDISLLGMTHYYCIEPAIFMPCLSYRKKLQVLIKILEKVKFTQCIIFCNSVHRVEAVCIDIKGFISAECIIKEKNQVDRMRIVELFKKNTFRVLVSSDVISRGLDAERVDLVINFDMPSSPTTYLARCGRAGRFGAKCLSITFLLKNQLERFNVIENEGQFISHALPESILDDFNCDINPSAVPSIPCNARTTCNPKENILASRTESSKNAIKYVEKTTTGETCFANKNGQTDNDEGSLVLIANEIEEQNATHLMGDLEMIKQENECAEDYQNTAKIKESEAHLLPTCVKSGSDSLETEPLKVTDTETACSSLQETDFYSEFESVPKCPIKTKSVSKLSEEYVLHKGFDEIHLDREKNCSVKIAKISHVTWNKKKSNENIKKSYNKTSVKSLGHCKSQSKSEKQVSFCGLKTTSQHIGKKKINKNCEMYSSRGEYVDRCDCLSQKRNFNVQRNSCCVTSQPCHFTYNHQPPIPSNYHQPPVPFCTNDNFYQLWMHFCYVFYLISYSLNVKKI